ncbi:MAG TPA: NAD-dependent epimerase/dehydratase family protein, partial [Caulobacteraceae bacterium]|nr:NAD-dependent epimerase/dehydratase family protein [Caulobacteraceae bacterium]
YDPALKAARVAQLEEAAKACEGSFRLICADLADAGAVRACFAEAPFDRVIHLAAQPGVRYSLENPAAYIQSNLVGFGHVLEACRYAETPHLTYASTSSVYGANTRTPYSESDRVDHPLQLYAATKRANELMAHAYSHLYGLPTTGLRFFTVYGPWGRPDMSPWLFTRDIIEGRPIKVFNQGRHTRAFTYVDDIADGVVLASDHVAQADPAWRADDPDPATSDAPFRLFNLGGDRPIALMDYIAEIERAVGKPAVKEFLPMQPGDAAETVADNARAETQLDYSPKVGLAQGMRAFVDWYRGYHAD